MRAAPPYTLLRYRVRFHREYRAAQFSQRSRCRPAIWPYVLRSEEHTSELQSRPHLVCRLLLEKKNDPQRPTEGGGCAAPAPSVARLYQLGDELRLVGDRPRGVGSRRAELRAVRRRHAGTSLRS